MTTRKSRRNLIRPSPSFRPSLLVFLAFVCLLRVGQSWLVAPANNIQFKKSSSDWILTASASNTAEDGMTMSNHDNNDNQQRATKKLILIRHARSEGNEFLARPGNEWGDPTFCDDANLLDAKLTETGMKQVQHELLPKFEEEEDYKQLVQQLDLVLVSPLTRTQETFQYGVLQALKQQRPDNLPPIVAHPLSTERVYTASDTGRSKAELSKEFPWVDWSLLDHNEAWWYSHKTEEDAQNWQEWRPFGEGQWYAVPGEPMEVFERRMKLLEEWIAARPQQTILLVAHWGVVRYLTGGYSATNCEVKILDPWKPLHQRLEEEKAEEEQAKL